MLGYTEEEIAGLTLYDMVILEKEVIDASIKKVLRDGIYIYGLRNYRCKNGSVIDVEISATLIHYGEAQVVMVNLRNITERRRTAKKLKTQATRLHEQAELLDIADDAIIVLNMEDRIFFWNHGAEELYGWTKDEVRGRVAYELLNTAFPQPLREIKSKLQSGGRWEGELVQIKRSGEKIVVESRWALRCDHQGNPVAIMEINNDITERKQTQVALQKAKDDLELRVAERTEELQNANERLLVELNRRKRIEEMLQKGAERYRNLFVNSPLGIYRISTDGRILMANPTLIRMLGYSSFDEMTSKSSKKKDYEPSYRRKKIKDRLEKEGQGALKLNGASLINLLYLSGRTLRQSAQTTTVHSSIMREQLRISQNKRRPRERYNHIKSSLDPWLQIYPWLKSGKDAVSQQYFMIILDKFSQFQRLNSVPSFNLQLKMITWSN